MRVTFALAAKPRRCDVCSRAIEPGQLYVRELHLSSCLRFRAHPYCRQAVVDGAGGSLLSWVARHRPSLLAERSRQAEESGRMSEATRRFWDLVTGRRCLLEEWSLCDLRQAWSRLVNPRIKRLTEAQAKAALAQLREELTRRGELRSYGYRLSSGELGQLDEVSPQRALARARQAAFERGCLLDLLVELESGATWGGEIRSVRRVVYERKVGRAKGG